MPQDDVVASEALTPVKLTSVPVPSPAQALQAAEDQVAARLEKRVAARMKMEKLKAEFYAQREEERVQKMIDVLEHSVGRPVEIADQTLVKIIELHANGEPLKSSCEAYGISRMQFYLRVSQNQAFSDMLARAREHSAQSKLDDTWVIARMEPDVERAKLLSEIARWEVSKVLPHLYGDKLKVELPETTVFSLNIGQLVENKDGSGK